MSALELRAFIIEHMIAARGLVIGLARNRPAILWQWDTVTNRLLAWPEDALDECVGWLRPLLRVHQKRRDRRLETVNGVAEEDDLIELCLDNATADVLSGPVYSLP
jgi:hypothetical protein